MPVYFFDFYHLRGKNKHYKIKELPANALMLNLSRHSTHLSPIINFDTSFPFPVKRTTFVP